MADEGTQIFMKPGEPARESSLFGVSIRGWIAWTTIFTVGANQLMATATACWLSIQKSDISFLGSQTTISEPLYGVVYVVMGYYFAKMSMPQQQNKTP